MSNHNLSVFCHLDIYFNALISSIHSPLKSFQSIFRRSLRQTTMNKPHRASICICVFHKSLCSLHFSQSCTHILFKHITQIGFADAILFASLPQCPVPLGVFLNNCCLLFMGIYCATLHFQHLLAYILPQAVLFFTVYFLVSYQTLSVNTTEADKKPRGRSCQERLRGT